MVCHQTIGSPVLVEPQGGMMWMRPREKIQQDGVDSFVVDLQRQ